MTCVFWKEGASKRHWGVWSPEGCHTEHPSNSQVLCRCNHLSYFAVLMVCVRTAWGRAIRAADGPALRTEKQGQGCCREQKTQLKLAHRDKKDT